jgi:hypothetical protein
VYRSEEGDEGQADGLDGRHFDGPCELDGCC